MALSSLHFTSFRNVSILFQFPMGYFYSKRDSNVLLDPSILPAVGVDRGAIRFLLAGANMMCPGFTSKGGRLPPPEEALPAGAAVAIFCEGKEHPAAVGLLKLGTEDIKKVNKDVGVEVVAYLGDGLWSIEKVNK